MGNAKVIPRTKNSQGKAEEESLGKSSGFMGSFRIEEAAFAASIENDISVADVIVSRSVAKNSLCVKRNF
jgi:hypothetical protein